ncbi:MAG: OB-fold nucleic acid binding domain-containing protein [Candidatus Micrarchaeaceae archaeon]
MKINELKAGASNVSIKAKIVKKEDPREVVTKYGKRLSVANITLEDDTGSILMSLWGNDIDKVNVGDIVEVTNGYVNEFRGTPQLSTGKFGKIEVIEKGNGDNAAEDTSDYDTTETFDDSADNADAA